MGNELVIRFGSPEPPLADFAAAWREAERGSLERRSVLTLHDWETLSSILAEGRYDLLRHLHKRPARSLNDLSAALGRPEEQVKDDVAILYGAGLLIRTGGSLRPSADRILVEILAPRSA